MAIDRGRGAITNSEEDKVEAEGRTEEGGGEAIIKDIIKKDIEIINNTPCIVYH